MRLPLWRRRQNQELEEEIQAHLREAVREKMERGQSADEAEREARREFGNVELVKEVTREMWGWTGIDFWIRDLRFGLRLLRRNPGFTAAATITLALGIGVNTAIFSYADGLLYRPLPVHDSARLLSLFHMTADSSEHSSFSLPDYRDFLEQNTVFSGLAAYSDFEAAVGDPDSREYVPAAIVSGNYFEVLGIKPVIGRFFLPVEDRTEGSHPVGVISYGLWERSFQRDSRVVGRRLVLNGHPITVIGVAPSGFHGTELYSIPDLWVPLALHRQAIPTFSLFGKELFANRGTHWLSLVGRLRSGLGRASAQENLESIARRQEELFPETNRGWTVTLVPADGARLGSPTGGSPASLARLLLAVAGLILLISCANVANLILSRSVNRRKEMGIRVGLGASRRRLFRQLLTEGAALSLLGGMLGLLLAWITNSWLASSELLTLIPGLDIRLDGRVLVFGLATTLLTGLVFGIVPGLRTSGGTLAASLREGRLSGEPVSRKMLGHHLLVVSQVAFCLISLVGAGLILRTMYNLKTIDLGFDPEGLLLVSLDARSRAASPEQDLLLYRALATRLRQLPQVENASLAVTTPFGRLRMANDVFTEDGTRFNVDLNAVDVGYFGTMGIPLLGGRDFREQDRVGSPAVAIINEAMAGQLWPDASDALGRSIRLWDPNGPGTVVEVVGVVANGRYQRSWKFPSSPLLFLPVGQNFMADLSFHIRTRGKDGAGLVIPALRQFLRQRDPGLEIERAALAEEARQDAIVLERMGAKLLSAFGVLALVLAALGIYGLISFQVSQRTHEIGIRMALGAGKREILRLLIRQSGGALLLGAATGWAGAYALSRSMEGLLYGVSSSDFPTFGGVTLLLVAIAVVAGYLPSRRATRVDPLLAIRSP